MSITAQDLETYARRLVTPAASEVQLRAAVSRAYYAVYHWCSEVAARYCGPVTNSPKAGVHEQLYLRLEQTCKDPKAEHQVRVLAQTARRAHELRIRADYQLRVDVSIADATKGLGYANGVKVQVKKLLASTPPAT